MVENESTCDNDLLYTHVLEGRTDGLTAREVDRSGAKIIVITTK